MQPQAPMIVNPEKPAVKITYADDMDLEESVMNVSGCNPLSAESAELVKAGPLIPKKAKAKSRFFPMEPIEECSYESQIAEEANQNCKR